MSFAELRSQLDQKKIGAVELTQHYLTQIEQKDPLLNSYITVCKEEALLQARQAQQEIDHGRSTRFTGIPLSVKDNICTKGVRTTCASKMLADFIPPYDASVIETLKKEHFILLGKTNMDEFAMGNTSGTSFYGAVKNPYDLTRIPGGSSGGAAASVCAGLCAAAIGTDTGGSVRQPAAHCGMTGLKPTYGAVSRWGLIAFSSSLDQIGFLTHSAGDAAYLLDGLCGPDPQDATTSSKASRIQASSKIGTSLKGLKIGLPIEFFSDRISAAVKKSVLAAAAFYEKQGCEILELSLPSLEYAVPAYYLISSAEAASNLARFDGIKYGYRAEDERLDFNTLVKRTRREGFGTEVKRRILLGNYALSSGYYDAYYKNALRIRRRLCMEYDALLRQCDFLLTPSAPATAALIQQEAEPAERYLEDICTVSANIAGLPAVSTPCGYDPNGLPIGMSLTGKAFDEKTIIAACDCFEQEFKRKEAVL
jgi:aspartyl-tRNA(Asn)/glutamyl-tRNA(Gln) amidotransferase subunit A